MNERTDAGRQTPAHPDWCVAADQEDAPPHEDGYHRDHPLHAEVQCYTVGISIGLTQGDERASGLTSFGGEPQLSVRAVHREMVEGISFVMNLREAEELEEVLHRQVEQLRSLHHVGVAFQPSMTLGWWPEGAGR